MLEMTIRKIWYRGAGVMLYRMTPDGECRVILFRRANNPDKGKYSVIGGKMDDRDKGDYSGTAARETREEVGISMSVPEDCPTITINLIFFKWKTFYIHYAGRIDRSRFSRSEIEDFIELPLEEAFRRPALARFMRGTLVKLRTVVQT